MSTVISWARLRRAVLVLLLAVGSAEASAGVVRIWGSEAAFDLRKRYHIALLRLALENTRETDGPFDLQTVEFDHAKFPPERALQLLDEGLLDVMGAMTSKEREKKWLPVRIPLTRGVIGYRVFIIRADAQAEVAAVNSVSQLKKLPIGVQSDWPDREILRKQGFTVVESPTYDGLFDMLQAGRFDLLTRGIHEPWDELRVHGGGKLTVDKTLLLHHPAADYFFVAKRNKSLADRIERGLRRALSEGTLQATLGAYYGYALTMANLSERRLIEIGNPELPPETPLDDPSLWLTMRDLGARLPDEAGEQSPKIAVPDNGVSKKQRDVVRVRGPEGPFDFRLHYHTALLNLAFEKTLADYGEYELVSVDYRSGRGMTQSKALEALEKDDGVDVVASMATEDRCQRLACLPVPLDRSLLGFRIFAARRQDLPRLTKIDSAAALKKLRICSGEDWPDTPIMRKAGLTVVTRKDIDSLYEALAKGECDALTRAAFEAWDEVVSRPQLDLVIEPKLALTYPTMQTFLLRKADKRLAARISEGLARARKDGSFARLFESVHRPSLERAGMTLRRGLALKNPLLPKELPVDALPAVKPLD